MRHSDLPSFTANPAAYRRAYMAKYRESDRARPNYRPRRPVSANRPVYGCTCGVLECDECGSQMLDRLLVRAGSFVPERSWTGCALGGWA